MITQNRLKELLNYDSETGEFTWISARTNKVKDGSVAGGLHPNGYRYIKVDGKSYREHTLAWLYVYGELPVDQIDHINRDKTDNRISNLRDVDNSINQRNKGIQSNNTSGVKGVRYCKTKAKWIAQISVNKVRKTLGTFADKVDAIKARREAEIEMNYGVAV